MRNKESSSFFDQSIYPIVVQYSDEDKVRLCKFLFNAFSDTAAKYFRTHSIDETDVKLLLGKEHEQLRQLLTNHLKSVIDEASVSDAAEKAMEADVLLKLNNGPSEDDRNAETDDQFLNDATIDMHLLLKELSEGS